MKILNRLPYHDRPTALSFGPRRINAQGHQVCQPLRMHKSLFGDSRISESHAAQFRETPDVRHVCVVSGEQIDNVYTIEISMPSWVSSQSGHQIVLG